MSGSFLEEINGIEKTPPPQHEQRQHMNETDFSTSSLIPQPSVRKLNSFEDKELKKFIVAISNELLEEHPQMSMVLSESLKKIEEQQSRNDQSSSSSLSSILNVEDSDSGSNQNQHPPSISSSFPTNSDDNTNNNSSLENILDSPSSSNNSPETITNNHAPHAGNHVEIKYFDYEYEKAVHEKHKLLFRDGSKPPFSYASMIAQCIIFSPERKLTLNKIYETLMENYPYFKTQSNGWQNSIRHNLSLNGMFVKLPRDKCVTPGKGAFWSIDINYLDYFENGIFKKRKGNPGIEAQHKKQQQHQLQFSHVSTNSLKDFRPQNSPHSSSTENNAHEHTTFMVNGQPLFIHENPQFDAAHRQQQQQQQNMLRKRLKTDDNSIDFRKSPNYVTYEANGKWPSQQTFSFSQSAFSHSPSPVTIALSSYQTNGETEKQQKSNNYMLQFQQFDSNAKIPRSESANPVAIASITDDGLEIIERLFSERENINNNNSDNTNNNYKNNINSLPEEITTTAIPSSS